MDMEKSASRFKFFDTARNFGCIFFCKNEELAYWKRQRKPCFHKERKKNNEKNQKKKRIRRKNAGKDIWAD